MDNKEDSNVAVVVGSPEENISTDRHALLMSRLKVAKEWSKKPHKAWKSYLKEYEIEDVSDTTELRDKVRIGYIFRKTESELPAIFDDQPELFIKGRNSNLKDLESFFEAVYDYLWDIQNLEEKIEDLGLYFVLFGMAFLSSPYVTKTEKKKEVTSAPVFDELGNSVIDPTTGQQAMQEQAQVFEVPIYDAPDAEVTDPFKIHFSPETKFNTVLDYEHCPYYFKEDTTMTKEAIKSRFGKEVEASEKLKVGDTDVDGEIDTAMETHKDDFNRVTVYEYYGVLPEELAKDIDGEWSYDKDYHIYLTSKEELLAEESRYSVKPCFIVGNYGAANKFWKFGDAKHLIPLVKELEKYRSQILNHTRKMANPKPLIEGNSEVDENAFNDSRIGKTVKYTGTKPEYLSPAPLGREVGVGVEMVRTDLEKTAPSFDLSGGGGQSQVKTPRGIQVFAEASDRSVRRKRKKFARLIRHLIIFQFGQLASFWKPEDLKILEVEGQEEELTGEMLQVLGDPNVLSRLDIEIESLSVNRVQQKQEALELFDLASKHPNIFNIEEIAKDLMQNGFGKRDADRYLIGEAERLQMMLQNAVQTINQTNPELALSVAQLMQNPQVMQALMAPQGQTPQAPQIGAGAQTDDPSMPDMPQI